MSELSFIRSPLGMVPHDPVTAEWMARKKTGALLHGKFTEVRNGKWHRKLFAALSIGFDAWEPPAGEYRGISAAKNFERFRSDVLIYAGHFEVVTNLKGETRVQAKSISYASLPSDVEFAPVYDACVDVLLRMVLKNYTVGEFNATVEAMLGFAS